jgi:hypothetical protein
MVAREWGGAALLLCASPFLAGRGGGEEGQCRAALFGFTGPVCSKIALSPLPFSLTQWLSRDLVIRGWMRWSRLHLEFFSGGMGRLALYPPAGIHGCRAPAPQLLAAPASTRCAAPSGAAPRWWRGGCRAASSSVARWTPEGPDRVLRVLWGPFCIFY